LKPFRPSPQNFSPSALLEASSWATDLSPTERAEVLGSIQVRRFKQGEYVCRRGEPATSWYGVCSGLVKSVNFSSAGKEATLTGVPAGGWFGEGVLLKNEPRPYDVITLRDSDLALVPKDVFNRLLRSSLSFNGFIIVQLNERLGQFIAMLEIERLFDPDVRTARTLAQLFHPHLYPMTGTHLSISQEEIGLLCGLSRPRANQALHVLEQEGLLRIEYGGVTVLDLVGLRNYEG
jgi:CRP-like cAMP-binding protein